MASSLCDHPDRTKTPSHCRSSRKVRVVAKIRDFSGPEAEFSGGLPWISVNKPNGEESESVTLSFREQSASRKESYEIDYCYDQYEDNGMIYSREVQPLIPGIIGGCNATVVALGARDSGKTCLIQGSIEKPGLGALAMAGFLSLTEKNGSSVAISSYEVYQDHVYDMLDPQHKLVLVQRDAQGKIQLKGLSKVRVKSVSEFYNICMSGSGSHKPTQKAELELPRRGHKGLILHISSPCESSDILHVGKMNFVDLAGYEGTKRKSIDNLNLVESSKIHKSIYAMLNVIHALNAGGNHVPYRESKLTHLLQDSLGGTSRVLMITCLKPSFCQDSIYMLSLVSRSCQNNNEAVMDSTKKAKNLPRSVVPSSRKGHIPKTTFATEKKKPISRVPLSDKKINGGSMASVLKGRKLFDETSQLAKPKKISAIPDTGSTTETSIDKEEKTLTDDLKPTREDIPLEHAENSSIPEKDISSNYDGHKEEVTPFFNSSNKNVLSLVEEVRTNSYASWKSVHLTVDNMEKENKDTQVNEDESPPISSRLQELSNHLKSLFTATPVSISLPLAEENDVSSYNQPPTNDEEPKTPVINQDVKNGRLEVAIINSPWQSLSVHNSEVKNTLVQEYLSFLNTASKEELKRLKGIGEKRATYILELRDESPKPFKNLDDLKEIGLSAKQIKGLMKKEVGGLFN